MGVRVEQGRNWVCFTSSRWPKEKNGLRCAWRDYVMGFGGELWGDQQGALWVQDPPGRVVTIIMPISIKC